MIKDPVTIDIAEPFSRVWDIFRMKKIRHLPVINNKRELRGIITQRDLYRTVSPRKKVEEEGLFYRKEDLDQFLLSRVMTENPTTLSQDQTLGHAIDMMVNKRYGCIPIVDNDKKLLGILTQIDLLRAVATYFI